MKTIYLRMIDAIGMATFKKIDSWKAYITNNDLLSKTAAMLNNTYNLIYFWMKDTSSLSL